MSPLRLFRRFVLFSPAVLLGMWLAGGTTLRAVSRDVPAPSSRPTVEPLAGPDLTIELESLQSGTRGGVARLVVRVGDDLDLTEAVLSLRAPGNLVLADGSKDRSWKLKPAPKGGHAIPVEVIIPEDGIFHVSVELTGLASGRPIRRGAAYELLVGVKKSAPRLRGGAIEYRAAGESRVQS